MELTSYQLKQIKKFRADNDNGYWDKFESPQELYSELEKAPQGRVKINQWNEEERALTAEKAPSGGQTPTSAPTSAPTQQGANNIGNLTKYGVVAGASPLVRQSIGAGIKNSGKIAPWIIKALGKNYASKIPILMRGGKAAIGVGGTMMNLPMAAMGGWDGGRVFAKKADRGEVPWFPNVDLQNAYTSENPGMPRWLQADKKQNIPLDIAMKLVGNDMYNKNATAELNAFANETEA